MILSYKHAERNTKGVLVGKSNIKTYEIKEAFLRNVPIFLYIKI